MPRKISLRNRVVSQTLRFNRGGITSCSPRRAVTTFAAILMAVSVTACSSADNEPVAGQVGYVKGFFGAVAADEPNITIVGRDALSAGASAADAAVAMAFMASVTYPSRAGLGSSGACLVFDTALGIGEAIDFRTETAPGDSAPVPGLARAMVVLHARYGKLDWRQLVAPAEQTARFGMRVSRAFAKDLSGQSPRLAADPGARKVFFGKDGRPLGEGDRLQQLDLAGTLGRIRANGGGSLYVGNAATQIAKDYTDAGYRLDKSSLENFVPDWEQPARIAVGDDMAEVVRGRAGAPDSHQTWTGNVPATPGDNGNGTGFVVTDRTGMTVSCAMSMGNLFGTGKLIPGAGFFPIDTDMAKRLAQQTPAVVIVGNQNHGGFRAALAGPVSTAAAIGVFDKARKVVLDKATLNSLIRKGETPATGNGGFTNGINCPNYIKGQTQEAACEAVADPDSEGLAVTAAQ